VARRATDAPAPGAAATAEDGWHSGPPTAAVAELLRSLELTITRRLDGALHGNFHGITPGHGSEPGESRPYQPGDDVRRIDWNVTARTNETHVREQIADRDLTAWLVVDASAAMRFGTVADDKARTALAATACVGFLTARMHNRLGAVLVAGPRLHVIPPRGGANQVRAVLQSVAGAPTTDGEGPAALGRALDHVGAIARRRGFVAVVSDLTGDGWHDALGRLGRRHDLLAITVHDRREYDLPPIGLVELVDPSTGAVREVTVTRAVQRAFADAAADERARRLDALGRAGAEVVELSTSGDWLAAIVRHVQHRRIQAVRGDGLGRAGDRR
jgi:uncharacterized protein (DUF58 family)